jgi:hypothetical protein
MSNGTQLSPRCPTQAAPCVHNHAVHPSPQPCHSPVVEIQGAGRRCSTCSSCLCAAPVIALGAARIMCPLFLWDVSSRRGPWEGRLTEPSVGTGQVVSQAALLEDCSSASDSFESWKAGVRVCVSVNHSWYLHSFV